MAFFGLQEPHLAGDNDFFGIRMMELRFKSAGVFVMNCVDGILRGGNKKYLFDEKCCQDSMFKFLDFLQPDSWESHPAARYCSEAVGPKRPKSLPIICLPEGIN